LSCAHARDLKQAVAMAREALLSGGALQTFKRLMERV
jgi:anthranilate phosphoribosyltransferase